MKGVRHLGFARTFHEECLDASEALATRGFNLGEGKLLAVHPYGHRNPFLRMLYASAFDFGFAMMPLTNLEQLSEVPAGLDLVVHYHWVHRIFDDLTTASAARVAVGQFLDTIKNLKDSNHSFVWTVHNILSHKSRFPDEEAELRGEFAQLVDHIHIMNPQTVALCEPHYSLDLKKIFHVPHPSYCGVYGDYISKEQARLTLGLRPKDKVFLLFGELSPYKGTRHFLGQVDTLQNEMNGKARIVIAGQEGSSDFMEDIYRLTAGRADVQLHIGRIDDQDVQTFFKAADVAVCAHTAGLNSGVAATALTFGCPTVMAEQMAGTVEGADGYISTFEASEMETIVSACANAFRVSQQPDCFEVLALWAKEYAPAQISTRFFEALGQRL